MIQTERLSADSIMLKGNIEKKTVEAICHKYKHLYKDGYLSGKEAREDHDNLHRWSDCPGVCFIYTVHEKEGTVIINVMLSNDDAIKRYTKRECEYFTQLYTQDVADAAIAIFG